MANGHATDAAMGFGIASLMLTSHLLARLVHIGVISLDDAREIADSALLGAEEHFGTSGPPALRIARETLKKLLDDVHESMKRSPSSR